MKLRKRGEELPWRGLEVLSKQKGKTLINSIKCFFLETIFAMLEI